MRPRFVPARTWDGEAELKNWGTTMWGEDERRSYLKKLGFSGPKVDSWSKDKIFEMTSHMPAF